jgi:hypothetical protein
MSDEPVPAPVRPLTTARQRRLVREVSELTGLPIRTVAAGTQELIELLDTARLRSRQSQPRPPESDELPPAPGARG